MNIKTFIKDMREKISLENNDIKKVLIHKTDYIIEVMDKMRDEGEKLIELQRDYKTNKKDQLTHYREEEDEDIFAQLKSKDDREMIMYSTDKLNNLADEIDQKKLNIRLLENLIKEIKDIPSTISTIIEWERHNNGY